MVTHKTTDGDALAEEYANRYAVELGAGPQALEEGTRLAREYAGSWTALAKMGCSGKGRSQAL